MEKIRILSVIFLVLLSNEMSYSFRILQVVPGLGRSHFIFNYKFAEMLKRAGHDVTLLTLVMSLGKLPDANPPDNIEEIRIGGKSNEHGKSDTISSFQDTVFQPLSLQQALSILNTLNRGMVATCQHLNKDNEFYENLSHRPKFDLLLSHYISLCPIGIAHRLNITKMIWVVPGTFIMDKTAKILSLPNLASFVPDLAADVSDRMNFVDRMKNFLFQLVDKSVASVIDAESETFNQFPNEHFPHLVKLAENTRALLINGENFLDFPRPVFTNVIHIGDLGHSQPKRLNEEWQQFMDNSEDGVIMFSLGTIANTSLMPIQMKEAYAEAFSQFPTYSIIWRLEGEMPKEVEHLKNLKIVRWIPQKELLHHPKLKLFITHGGYNSLLETAQAGVPMILIPLFGDQYGNARRAERHGLGLTLDKLHPDSKHIAHTIRRVLNHEKFQNNSKKFSTMLQDKIISSENLTLYLLNKIVRSNNWPLPRSPKKLNYFQYFCLDIIFVFLLSIIAMCYTLHKVFKFIYTMIIHLK